MTSTADPAATATGLHRLLGDYASRFDPGLVSAGDASRLVEVFAGIEHMASYLKTVTAERVASTSAWQGSGSKSPADWLADKTGSTVGEAASTISTGKRLKRLPKTRKAMARGRLSRAKAEAVADGAAADPEAEEDLLGLAERASAKNVKDEARRRRAAVSDDAMRDRRVHARRCLRNGIDDDGAFTLFLKGTSAAGARLVARLRPLQEQAFRTARHDGVRESFEARSYDAFFALLGLDPHGHPLPPPPGDRTPARNGPLPIVDRPAARSRATRAASMGTSNGSPPTGPPGSAPSEAPPTGPSGSTRGDGSPPTGAAPSGSAPSGSPPATGSPPPPPPVGGANTKVIVRIDHSALVRGHAVAGETVEIAGLGPITVAAAKDLMADAFLAAVITKGRDVTTVAHLGRSPTAYQRTALEAQHIACTNTACNATIGIEIDHRDPWADTHQTPTAGLDPLCSHCHRLKTHHGHTLEPGSGPRRLLGPDQQTDSSHRSATDVEATPPAVRQPQLL